MLSTEKMIFFFPLMEFPIDFKTIMEVHLVLSLTWSWVQVLKHQVPIPVLDTATATKNFTILFKPEKKNRNTEHRNWIRDCISQTVFLRLHFWDRSPEITGIRTAFPRSRKSGLHFKYHRSRIAFLQVWKSD